MGTRGALLLLMLAACGEGDKPAELAEAERLLELAPGAAGPAIGLFRCEISKKHLCGPGGCETAIAAVWNAIDLEQQTFARCDRNGCDTYQAAVSESGVFTNIAIVDRGLMARLSATGEFMEVASLGTTAYVSHGRCIRQREQ